MTAEPLAKVPRLDDPRPATAAPPAPAGTSEEAWAAWRTVLGSPRKILAPMADCSVLAFRLLAKRHGCEVCYTPMVHASSYSRDPSYRRSAHQTCPEDFPVVVQLCGNEPDAFCESARVLEREGLASAIDVNMGCPQRVAKRGMYGSFLADSDPELCVEIVRRLRASTSLPVFCKMRVWEDQERTLRFARSLREAGAMAIAVHGRTMQMVDLKKSEPDWSAVARIVSALDVPVVANGGVKSAEDAERCARETGAAAVMVGTGLLRDPALFSGERIPPCDMAREFLEICERHPPTVQQTRGLLVKLLLPVLNEHTDIRDAVVTAQSLEEFRVLIAEMCQVVATEGGAGLAGERLAVCREVSETPEWGRGAGDSDVELSLVPGEGFTLWREFPVAARAPTDRQGRGCSAAGSWVVLLGLGHKVLRTAVLRTIRQEKARWKCKTVVTYVEVLDEALRSRIVEEKKAAIYYKVLRPRAVQAAAGDPPAAAAKND